MTIPTKLQDVIIRAALESLEQFGMEGLTVRKIAARAGVNVAAINYHFRSKEKLLEQVFDLASTNAFGDIDQLITAKSGKKLEQQLETFFTALRQWFDRIPERLEGTDSSTHQP